MFFSLYQTIIVITQLKYLVWLVLDMSVVDVVATVQFVCGCSSCRSAVCIYVATALLERLVQVGGRGLTCGIVDFAKYWPFHFEGSN